MSGHSKWSTIKRKKAASDAKRGRLFTKIARELTVAARQGGGDPDANFRLRLVIDMARQANMPKDSIERAIKRGTGEIKGEAFEEIRYEVYAPHGVALILDALTDNRKRAVADIRRLLTRSGGSLGETGSVTWLFDQKGLIIIEADGEEAEGFALQAIDAGADDVRIENGLVEIYTQLTDFQKVRETLEREGVPFSSAEMTMVPKSQLQLGEKETIQIMHLIEALEDLEDVQQVYSNLEISAEMVDSYEYEAA
ncbi:MAG: YebC/PmpR family DNA-binding transcriptional regulator [Anaerolineae bacterium]|nr:YebC/PmpR family DNA-binding transcriptional regulator [Anaerolineae bacterium]